MPRLGSFDYPSLTLTESVPIADRIARGFGGTVSRSGLARALEMSERGGRFSAVAGALRAWGLLEGRSDLRITRLGAQLASPVTREEATHARSRAAACVPLLVELSHRFGTRTPDHAQLALVLEDIASADRREIEAHASTIQRIFRDVAHDLAGTAPEFDPGLPGEKQGAHAVERRMDAAPLPQKGDPPVVDTSPEWKAADGSTIHLEFPGGSVFLPETSANLDAVIAILQARRDLLARGE